MLATGFLPMVIIFYVMYTTGLPLFYVGGLTVPLGFARNDGIRKSHTYDYGYEQTQSFNRLELHVIPSPPPPSPSDHIHSSCYLNPKTSFIWSMLTPVILIYLANTGFFIMTFVIIKRQEMLRMQ